MHSPYINPFNFYFRAAAQRQVYPSKVSSIGKLIEGVKPNANKYSECVLKNVTVHVLKRASLLLQAQGGYS